MCVKQNLSINEHFMFHIFREVSGDWTHDLSISKILAMAIYIFFLL